MKENLFLLNNRKGREIVTCGYCGKEFSSQISKKAQFCSYSCSTKYKHQVGIYKNRKMKGVYVKCEICGKEIYRKPYSYCKAKIFFCSNKCRMKYEKRNGATVNCSECGKQFNILGHKRNKLNLFCSVECQNKWHSKNMLGEKNPSWKGGITPLNSAIRGCAENLNWRLDVFARDGFKCQHCKDASKRKLNAHHKKPFIQIMQENSITTLDEARACKELWDIDNGITLCKDCHELEHKKTRHKEFDINLN